MSYICSSCNFMSCILATCNITFCNLVRRFRVLHFHVLSGGFRGSDPATAPFGRRTDAVLISGSGTVLWRRHPPLPVTSRLQRLIISVFKHRLAKTTRSHTAEIASFDGLRPLLVACHCQPFVLWQINFVRSPT